MNAYLEKAWNFVVWLFWFYIELGKETSWRFIAQVGLASILLIYFSYECVFGEWAALPWTDSRRWTPITMAVLMVPPATLVLYGYFFGARHQLEELDPAYTTPSPLTPYAFAATMIFIALSKYFEWW